jgi:hypothetical protein
MGEVALLAANLARNCRWRVFPCRNDKRPACPHGFNDASDHPATIADLWRRFPAPLIGIATGEASGIDVLDVDITHDSGLAWWRCNQLLIPITRAFRTRSGGVHIHMLHSRGLGCSVGKLAPGVDVRADGGYAIFWFAAGLPCLDHSPPAPWPSSILAMLMPRPTPAHWPRRLASGDQVGKAVDGILRRVAGATKGERNSLLHWGSCRLGERVLAGQLSLDSAEEMLIAAATVAGLAVQEARSTARSGLRRVMR